MMTDQDRITRLERTMGTLISWLYPIPFTSDTAVKLLEMLEERPAAAPCPECGAPGIEGGQFHFGDCLTVVLERRTEPDV